MINFFQYIKPVEHQGKKQGGRQISLLTIGLGARLMLVLFPIALMWWAVWEVLV